MKIATLLFTYKRSYHTQQVVSALQQNTVYPQKLFIFQDGLKDDADIHEWDSVNKLIHDIDWCPREIIVSKSNRGLADAVVAGVNYAFRECDAVIVLEDDCVPHSNFMAFMTASLQKYQHENKVYTVSGYAYPVNIESNGTDAYFTRRITSWGWGTWKDRWLYYDNDYRILGRIKNNTKLAEELHIWGADLESYILGNIYGRCNSWAVFWALTVIERGGYCLSRYKSLVKNIGFDGSGVNCAKREFAQDLQEENRLEVNLPEEVEIPESYKLQFADYFSWTSPEERVKAYNGVLLKWIEYIKRNNGSIADKLLSRGIHRCSIWGKGSLCDLLLDELKDKIQICSIVESVPVEKTYRGISVISINEITKDTQLIIVIPFYDFSVIERAIKRVIECEIMPLNNILDL